MKIADYSSASPVTLSSKLIGTNLNDNQETQNFVLSDIQDLFQTNIGTLQAVLDTGNTATQNIILTGNITGIGNFSYTVGTFSSVLAVFGGLLDVDEEAGYYGDTLMSTEIGVQWHTKNYLLTGSTFNQSGAGVLDITYDFNWEQSFIIVDTDNATIIFPNKGVYTVDLMASVYNDDSSTKNVYFWIMQNGVIKTNSQVAISLDAGKQTSVSYSWLIKTGNANETIKMQWQSNSTDIILQTLGGSPGTQPDGCSVKLRIAEL